MTVTVRWPDGEVLDLWSPSLVLHDHLSPGETTVAEFTARCTRGLAEASERVRERFGFACTSAAATADQVLRRAEAHDPGAVLTVLRLWPPLPQPVPAAPEEAP